MSARGGADFTAKYFGVADQLRFSGLSRAVSRAVGLVKTSEAIRDEGVRLATLETLGAVLAAEDKRHPAMFDSVRNKIRFNQRLIANKVKALRARGVGTIWRGYLEEFTR